MKNYILRTKNLTKSYHGINALHDVSIALESGKIYGLIGQNGAGKSTLMRLIAGLSFPTEGSIELFGHTGESAMRAERKRLGSMIEYPSLVPNMTAKENLRVHRIMKGIPDEKTEDDLLKLVGLTGTNKKKAKNFSLGMKQRLGIATALLGDPELLILDEPINGLDPIGVVEIRNFLKKLCEEQHISILISSHNLPELFQMATDYILIQQGQIKQTITIKELEERCRRYLLIGSLTPEKMVSVLEMKLDTHNFRVMPDKTVKLYDFLDEKERVAQILFENGIVVTTLCSGGDTLEDYYVSVMGGGRND